MPWIKCILVSLCLFGFNLLSVRWSSGSATTSFPSILGEYGKVASRGECEGYPTPTTRHRTPRAGYSNQQATEGATNTDSMEHHRKIF